MLRRTEWEERGRVSDAPFILFVPYRIFFFFLFGFVVDVCLPGFTDGYVRVSDSTSTIADGQICSLILFFFFFFLRQRFPVRRHRKKDMSGRSWEQKLTMAVVSVSFPPTFSVGVDINEVWTALHKMILSSIL